MMLFRIDELLADSDSEPEEDKPGRQKKGADRKSAAAGGAKKGATASGRAWLQEGGEDDITDFMDLSAAKKVMGRLWVLCVWFCLA